MANSDSPALNLELDEEELQTLQVLSSTSSGEPKKPATERDVTEAWRQVFAYLSPEAQRALLEESPAKTISQLSPERPQEAMPSFQQDIGLRGGLGTPDGSEHDGGDEGQAPAGFPQQEMKVYQELAKVPPEILVGLEEFLPPIDELILSHTHPDIINTDSFSFYRMDVKYQKQWQTGNPNVSIERLPLLYHAITDEAPMSVVTDILETWQAEGMDLELAWTVGTARTRTDQRFIRPILWAGGQARVDLVEELRSRGVDIRELVSYIMLTPHSKEQRQKFTDVTWWRLETLALALHDLDRPRGNRRHRWCEACAMAGWTRLMRHMVDPMLKRDPMMVNTWFLRVMHWHEQFGRYRHDNKSMIDYVVNRFWVNRVTVPAPTPKRHLNASYLIYHIVRQDEFHWFSLTRTMPRYIEECAADDDSLPLTRALHDGLVDLTRRYSYAWLIGGAKYHQYSPARHPDILRSYMLRIALTSPQGAPLTVRWLVSQGLVPLQLNMMELGRPHALQSLAAPASDVMQTKLDALIRQGRPHALQGLGASASEDVLRSNLDALMARLDPNAVVPELSPLRPLDLVHESDAALVELVARAPAGHEVDLNLESHQVWCAARQTDIRLVTNGRSLRQLMACGGLTYEVRRRVLDWCLMHGTGALPAVMTDV
ncbi:hypothetical protein PG994_003264 [Apiospora phragmitis]|uniref:Uncharacterized protein n=1 Tax=Apiospora phragmitis TaxID=2905665 RepID=A0ABR1VXM8_9PEZI